MAIRFFDEDDQQQQQPGAVARAQVTEAPSPPRAGGGIRFISDEEFEVLSRQQQRPDFEEPSVIEKIQKKGSSLVSQFQQGAETAERGVTEILGLGERQGARRTPLTEPRTVGERAAKLTGEFIAPLPQFAGIPGIAFAVNQAGGFAGRVGKNTKAFRATQQAFNKLSQGATRVV